MVAPLQKQDITPGGSHPGRRHSQTVAVYSRVCQPSQVPTQLLQDALVDSINQSGLFARAAGGGRADYRLDVSLVSVQWPTTGATMSSKAEMLWKLTRPPTGKVVFQETLRADYSETMFNTLLGSARSHAVMRGAIRNNVQQGIARLGNIDF